MAFAARPVIRSLALTTLAAVGLSCVPVLSGTGPSGNGNPPAAVPAAGQAAQPTAGQAVQAGATAPTAISATIEIVVPAGAIAKLQTSLRAQATVPSSDFRAADLQKMVVQLDGEIVPPSEYTIEATAYDSQQQLVLTIVLKHPPAKATPVRVATADGTVALLGETATNGQPTRVDIHSTATALLNQLLRRPESEADRQAYEKVIAQFQYNLITSSQPRKLDSDLDMTGLLQRISTQIANGTPVTPETLAKLTTPPSTGGGTGCGFGVAQTTGSTTTGTGSGTTGSGTGSGTPTGSGTTGSGTGSGTPTGSGTTGSGTGSGTPTGSGTTGSGTGSGTPTGSGTTGSGTTHGGC